VLRSAISQTDHTRRREPEQGLLEITVEEVVSGARNLLRNRIAKPHVAERSVAENQ